MKRLLAAAAALLIVTPAAAQAVKQSRVDGNRTGAVVVIPTGGFSYPSSDGANSEARVEFTAPLGVATTSSNGTTNATAGTFTVALPANASRRDCTIYSASAYSIALGTSPQATQSIPVAAGGTFKCSSAGGTVATDQVNISSTTASAAYVVWSQ